MQLFYSQFIQGDAILLNEEEASHAVRVLRKKEGDQIQVTDGKGNLYECKIIQIDQRKSQLEIISTQHFSPRKNSLHIAIAPTKNIDRFEWFLEKAGEFGIEEITPLICDRSERKIIKPERLEKILMAGMKQSLHFYLPVLHEAISFKKFMDQTFDSTKNLAIAHCADAEKIKMNQLKNAESTLILIGPEGDFTTTEIELALKKGFQALSLGNFRLRTETAGIAAAHEHALLIHNV